jgi:hypothetical protein
MKPSKFPAFKEEFILTPSESEIKPIRQRGGSKQKVKLKSSHNYFTTDGQSASLSWFQAPIWGLRQMFVLSNYLQTVERSLMWGTLSDERLGL